ncbi:unnamed protein product [Diatraea saccharalis]|uniref:CN hydrolase domain-containing protein n=1 Tax=Diatraea saccharalis TaxID=40085 RepID=A0A9N9R8I9_9NEOP|nr:unnamed protein product [Diatraea saccharalis]
MFCTKFLLLLTYLIKITVQTSSPSSTSYVAAVLEYNFENDTAANLRNYLIYIQEASSKNADIIVFPELTLNRGQDSIEVPINGALKDHPIPALAADLYHKVLVDISNAARQNKIYVVINIEEIMDCNTAVGEYCPAQQTYLFNTNVVFDRDGTIIDRYRKINLFGEFTRTPALRPDLGVFTTDFGVTFAHYICFDLLFQVPAMQVVDKLNVTDVIFPTMWFSEMPYLSAVQIQEGYAFAMDVNFLAAGSNNVRVGSSGSGIFSGKAGALISTMPGLPTTKLLVATVPKIPGQVTSSPPGPIYDNPVDHDSLTLITDPSLESHFTRLLTPGLSQFTMISGEVICVFKVNMTENEPETEISSYKYRAAVFNGVRSYSGMATGGIRVCSVIACTGDSLDTCGKRFPQYKLKSTAVFHELNIIATMPTPVIEDEIQARDTIYFPLSLDTSIMPLEPDDYTYSEDINGNVTTYSMFLDRYDKELYSFAIWGRIFSRDGQEEDPKLPQETTLSPTEETTENQDVTTEHQDNTTENQDDTTEHQDNTTENQDDTTEHQDNTTEHQPDSSVTHLISKTILITTFMLLIK